MKEEEAEGKSVGGRAQPVAFIQAEMVVSTTQAVVVAKPETANIRAVDHCNLSYFTDQCPSGGLS